MVEQYQEVRNKSNKKIILYTITILFVLAISTGLVFFLQKEAVCGNGLCENDEDCSICIQDCKCDSGKYCSLNKCVSPECGNGVCEPFEKPDICCVDCECWNQGEVCNKEKNKCEVKEFEITNDRIKEIVTDYFESRGRTIDSIEIKNILTWENKLGRNVHVKLTDQDRYMTLVIMEDEKVFEIEF